ncbi:hypothetical protein BGZ51_008614 [Haplosporangium sp. Z 767]|nr:hypothetical protein BGZ50_007960 [Haplosporangium sp. Z 11]KAF9194683.1 hypothetical protein BGZ51_008614 [Haplosporangium sp. Z 767]
MSQSLSFNTVDVFTDTAFTGNPLAIVHVPNNVTLSQDQKQKIAIEFNFSETVFLHQPPSDAPSATYKVDIFTPKSEIPFAGHPTIGTACYIFENLEQGRSDATLVLKAGEVKATFDRSKASAGAAIPHDFREHANKINWDRIVASQSGLTSDTMKNTKSTLVSIVKGMNFVLIDLTPQPELLDRVKVTIDDIPIPEDLDEGWPDTLLGSLFFVRLPDQGDGVTRVQQRMISIGVEDPATGSASTALCSYLALEKGAGGARNHVFELVQGVEMGRRSVIGCEVLLKADGKSIDTVFLTGQSKAMMKGELSV